MKKSFTIAVCLLMAVAACSSYQEEQGSMECAKRATNEVFYATIEQSGGADATKVYADEDLKVLWNADDRITIYNRYTYGYEYAFQGATGKTAGTFAKINDGAEFVTGNALDEIYAVYPHSSENEIDNAGHLTITWPSPQTYKADSFGIGANVMVSVTDDNQLRFRNVGGYLALKLYGDNVSVSSITLRGNNGEKLSGRATVTCASDANPSLTFQSASSESLRLECTAPVHLGSTAGSATIFWLVVPPTEFTEGFNITVRTSNGLVFYKSTDIAYEIERNTLTRMAAVEVVPGDIIPFADANFKAYCVDNFDTDSDGEISLSEALAVATIDVNTESIESIQGIEFFENLTQLSCSGTWIDDLICDKGRLAELDVSSNLELKHLSCFGNHLTFLDVSNNTELTSLICWDNQLTELNLSNNAALTHIDCSFNQLSFLDVGNNIELAILRCGYNELSDLDVRKNKALTFLDCDHNQLTNLDVTNNTLLESLYCWGNQLKALDISHNTVLIDLYCGLNQLTSLDVSNNASLKYLYCQNNQLSSLDVSNNTGLTFLQCGANQLTSLVNDSANTALTDLYCTRNQLTSLDVSNDTALSNLYCDDNQLTSLNVSNNTAITYLRCNSNQLTSLDVSNNTAITSLLCSDNQLTALDVSNNTALTNLRCNSNPYLTDIWLKTGQTIQSLSYDSTVAQIHYKD